MATQTLMDWQLLILFNFPKMAACDRISDLLTALRTQVFTAPDGNRFQVDFGVAIAEYPTDGITLQSLYQIASSTLPVDS